jgi:hypothetical protein
MVHPSMIEARLGELGFRASRWFRAEIHELQHILMDNEKIISLACGRYFGSFALLVATDQRLLIIDKRVFFMTIEDIRYDMISEIDYNSQAYNATVTVYTLNKTHKFTSIKFRRQLRELTSYVQRRVWEFRQQQNADLPNASTTQPTLVPLPEPPKPIFEDTRPEYIHYSAPEPTRPMAAQPNDYYIDDQKTGGQAWRSQMGYVAHKVGSAATRAAHHAPHPHLPHRQLNPYTQGSLMTRRPLGTDYYQY